MWFGRSPLGPAELSRGKDFRAARMASGSTSNSSCTGGGVVGIGLRFCGCKSRRAEITSSVGSAREDSFSSWVAAVWMLPSRAALITRPRHCSSNSGSWRGSLSVGVGAFCAHSCFFFAKARLGYVPKVIRLSL